MNNKNKKLKTFGKIIAGVLLLALNIFVSGIVLMHMWNWFIAPLGLPKIGFWLAYGIMLTIRLFIGIGAYKDKTKFGGYYKRLFIGISVGLIIWGIGAIVQLFV